MKICPDVCTKFCTAVTCQVDWVSNPAVYRCAQHVCDKRYIQPHLPSLTGGQFVGQFVQVSGLGLIMPHPDVTYMVHWMSDNFLSGLPDICVVSLLFELHTFCLWPVHL